MKRIRETIHRAVLSCGLVTVAVSAWAASDPVLVMNASRHTGGVRRLMFSPGDRPQVLTASLDGTARIWSLDEEGSSRILRSPLGDGQYGEVYEAVFHPNGRHVLTCGWFTAGESDTHGIRCYDRESGKLISVTAAHSAPIRALAISPNGRFVASGDHKGVIHLWSFQNGREMRHLTGRNAHKDRVIQIVFAKAGTSAFCSIGYDKIAKFWSYDDSGFDQPWEVRPEGLTMLTGIATHPNRPIFAIGGYDGTPSARSKGRVNFYTSDGHSAGTSIVIDEGVHSIDWGSGGDRIVIGGGFPANTSTAHVVDWPSRRTIARYRGHGKTIAGVRISPDGRMAASVDVVAGNIHYWRLNDAQLHSIAGSEGASVWSVGIDTRGGHLLWGEAQYNPDQSVSDKEINNRGPFQFRFDPKGATLRAVSRETLGHRGQLALGQHQIKIDRPAGSDEIMMVRPHNQPFRLPISHDKIMGLTLVPMGRGTTPVCVGSTYGATVFEGATGRRLFELVGHRGVVTSVAAHPTKPLLVTGGSDGTVRCWNAHTGELLLSIFREEQDWVAWLPTGHYVSSPLGERLIGWQINHGDNVLPDFFEGTQFHDSLYRPDVVATVLETLNVRAALEATAVKDEIGKVLPPEIELMDKKDLYSAGESIAIRVRARARHGELVKLTLYRNGRPMAGAEPRFVARGLKTDWVNETWTIEAPKIGQHEFFVRAHTRDSHADSPPIKARAVQGYDPGQETRDRALNALVIGVARYEDEGIPRLNYSNKDATVFARTLEQYARPLYKNVRVKLITDDQATKRGILEGMDWLRKNTSENDVGLVFFSGHGTVDEGRFFFLPCDTRSASIRVDALDSDEFHRRLADISAWRLVVMLDACHSGGVGAMGSGDESKSKSLNNTIHALKNSQPAIDVMCSTDADSVSRENHDIQHGYFAHALIKGMEGHANNRQGDDIVTQTELAGYVGTEVRALSASSGPVQIPLSGGTGMKADLPLTKDRGQ